MNMMRYDFDELELEAQLVDSSKVIEGYIYLSEELVEEKNQERQERRKTILFSLLLVSVGIFLWDKNFFLQTKEQLQPFHSSPTLSKVLANSIVDPQIANLEELVDVPTQIGSVEIPEDIVKFIDADIFIEKLTETSSKVILQEIQDSKKNKPNLDKILASGNKLFKRDRLLSPPVHNAFSRYEKVLSVYPNHPEALQGIENIVNRYVYLAEMVIKKNEGYKVPELIKKAYQAGEKYMDVSVIITKFSDYLSNDSVFVDFPIVEEAVQGVNEQGSSEAYHVDMIYVADRKISEAAYKLYADGDVQSAEKVLQNFTKLSGFWGESNDLLLKIYLGDSKIAEAENLIYESKTLDVYQFAEKAARVMMARGDNQGALDMLAAYRPEFSKNKAYYTLLASLYNKVGHFKQSVYWYRQLLSVSHDDARLWLGLAVSLDALNDVDHALKAFDYVRLYAKDESLVKDYINERTMSLASK
ncbi:hypothetical protein AB835_10615 [Candidatus Endobugula sertula]|uniref:Uncharacterized protein n=1 Tax=Candidatus Endobugula sertula TaxID=62101 RepID=A0A1D2QNF2_9GAMM|nr:hypothetical protein AB835_10615 [Candidatus Endobugula sertula]